MTLTHPFQKLCTISLDTNTKHLLVAASGPTISCILLSNGQLLSQWPLRHNEEAEDTEDDREESSVNKRRKLDVNGRSNISRQPSEASDISLEIVSERKKGERKKSKFIDIDAKLPNVSHLLTTLDGKYVIAVTAEDKCIRVFELKSTGRIGLISFRSLPKKLCAIKLTNDGKTILVADKFGDVYAMPVHQAADWKPEVRTEETPLFKPSATELTVHTKGNLAALRQQQVQKLPGRKKEAPEFNHQLILGHVSLLTDLTSAEGNIGGRMRPFIITSDRDEHIRISRGIPQAHVIENFCLGQRDFVTKLLIPQFQPHRLISGNGEPSLRIYDWQEAILWKTIDLGPLIRAALEKCELYQLDSEQLPENRQMDRLAVSGIWEVAAQKPKESLILVAIEGFPILFTFLLNDDDIHSSEPIFLTGNVLDVVVLEIAHQIVVSIDHIHEPFSMKAYRSDEKPQAHSLQIIQLYETDGKGLGGKSHSWKSMETIIEHSKAGYPLSELLSSQTKEKPKNKLQETVYSILGEFLYGLEALRKKRHATADEDAAPDGADPADEDEQ